MKVPGCEDPCCFCEVEKGTKIHLTKTIFFAFVRIGTFWIHECKVYPPLYDIIWSICRISPCLKSQLVFVGVWRCNAAATCLRCLSGAGPAVIAFTSGPLAPKLLGVSSWFSLWNIQLVLQWYLTKTRMGSDERSTFSTSKGNTLASCGGYFQPLKGYTVWNWCKNGITTHQSFQPPISLRNPPKRTPHSSFGIDYDILGGAEPLSNPQHDSPWAMNGALETPAHRSKSL